MDTNLTRRMLTLAHLPKKIVSLEGTEHTPSFVLHELCDEHCFNLKKAAFFADSPDFNSLRGVAGFDQQQKFVNSDMMWQDPAQFIEHVKAHGRFHEQVKHIRAESLIKQGQLNIEQAQKFAQQLGITNPVLSSWPMKHDNVGILIYENPGHTVEGMQEQLNNSLYLLNFCPLL